MALVLVLLLPCLGLLTVFAGPVRACSCAGPDPSLGREEIVKSTLANSEAVFSGRMQRSSIFTWNDAGYRTVRFEVARVWKGPEREVIEVKTPDGGGGGCGYPFRRGQEYLVYADRGMSVSLCNATSPLAESRKDIEILGNAAWKSDLPDTGGTAFGLSFWNLALLGVGLSAGIWVLNGIRKRSDPRL